MSAMATIKINVKWGKENVPCEIKPGQTPDQLFDDLQNKTGVPVARQKLSTRQRTTSGKVTSRRRVTSRVVARSRTTRARRTSIFTCGRRTYAFHDPNARRHSNMSRHSSQFCS